MDETLKKCPGDCSKCSSRQNMCCASQIALDNHNLLIEIKQKLDVLIEPMAQEREAAQIIDSQDKDSKK